MGALKLCLIASFLGSCIASSSINFVDDNFVVNRSGNTKPNLVQLAKNLHLNLFVDALVSTNLSKILNHEGPFTVFAPTNKAFRLAPSYCKNVPLLDRMKYHVTRDLHPAGSLKNDEELWTILSHRYVRINIYNKTKAVTASGRRVVLPDQMAFNGIIHVIDTVMCSIYKGGAMFEINRCPDFKLFTTVVNMTGLFKTLDQQDPLTIFAPTNKALSSLPSIIRQKLLSNSTLLKMVVMNHVVPQTVYRVGMYDAQKLKSGAGFSLKVSIGSNGVFINKRSKIILPDATVKNGVVHSIDKVLLPPFM